MPQPQSLGITNAQDLLQVSPTDTALELTQSTPAISNTPNRYYESLKTYGRTFARVVPSTAVEAKVQVAEMKAQGVTRLYVANDSSPYGEAIASAVKTAAAPGITIVSSASGADAMFYGGDSGAVAARALTAAAQANPALKLFGPSALDTPSFAGALGPAARHVFISSPGFLPKDLLPAGRTFVSDFTKTYGHAPSGEAIFGYAAMQAVLYALSQSGSSVTNRATVVKKFFGITNVPSSVIGTYSINSNGDTSLTSFVFSRLRGGALVPFTSVTPQGCSRPRVAASSLLVVAAIAIAGCGSKPVAGDPISGDHADDLFEPPDARRLQRERKRGAARGGAGAYPDRGPDRKVPASCSARSMTRPLT